jgi:hypothetical protein
MHCHENSSYAWVDVFFGPNKAAMHVTDKSILEIVKTLRHHRVKPPPMYNSTKMEAK